MEEEKCICEIDKGKEKIIVKGNWTDLYIRNTHDEYNIIGEGDGRVYMKINYCPICGREL